MTRSRVRWMLVFALFVLAACTPAAPYRTNLSDPPPECPYPVSGRLPAACENARHEHSKDYDLLFVEFDDQGVLYPSTPDGAGSLWPPQINELMHRLRRLGDTYKDQGISLYVFVHGWKHNASADDDNVRGFREVLQSAALVEEASQVHHRVIGIYVAWRGLSATMEPFLELSFWERKATALYVAQGSARGLLTRLKGFQRGINCRRSTDCIAGEPRPGVRPMVRLIMIGHSFGGLILFNAISEAIVEGLTYREDSGDPSAPALRFGDMVVLLNPAFEAIRYTPLHRIVTSPHREFKRYQAPILVSVTSTADWATRWAFPLGRFFNTLFEKTASPEEKTAIKNTVGHVGLYVTHKLTRSAEDPAACQGWKDISTLDPAARLEQVRINLKAEAKNNDAFFGPGRPVLKDQWVRKFCGGATLKHVKYGANLPIWNVETDNSIIKGHDDIKGSVLANFLRQLYTDSYFFPLE